MEKRKKIINFSLAILLTMFLITGTSFFIDGSFDIILKHPVITIIATIIVIKVINSILSFLFNKLDNMHDSKSEKGIYKNKFIKWFDNNPFKASLLFIIAGWLIYIIAFYPAILSPDPSFQILQYFKIDNKYSDYVVLLDKNVILTNHHPVIHTLLIGTCLKIGLSLFNSTNIGLFIYSIIQTLILASTLSYTIKFMKDLNLSIKYRLMCLIIYAFVPVFPFYSLSAVKDVIFGCLIILYIISIYKFIKKKNKITNREMIYEIVLLILITLFRNNGFHIVLLSFPLLFLLGKANILKYLLIFLIFLSFNFTYNKIILPHYKITPSSIREVLSIPFQQTARYVKYHERDVSNKERKAIDKVLGYDSLASRYKPKISDPVKNEFNKYSTKKDLKNYFIAWKDGLIKHPKTYVEATINNTYGYFYPVETNWYIYTKYNDTINNYGFNYNFNNLKWLRNILKTIGLSFPYIPIIGLLVNIGFNTWIILFMISYLLYKKKYKEIIYLIPSIIILLVCIASPVNTYFRYALPNIFGILTMLAIFIKELKITKKDS